MRIAIVHNSIPLHAPPEDLDLLEQIEGIEAALRRLGHETFRLECTLNLERVAEQLRAQKPDLIFNLVESLAGTDRLMVLATALFEALQIPFTGSSSEAILVSSNKLLAKRWIAQAGLPTAAWLAPGVAEHARGVIGHDRETAFPAHYIVKTQFEHASLGLDDHAVAVDADLPSLRRRIEERAARLGKPCFAERFIDGREFNVGVLAGKDGFQTLPPAEILFEGYAAQKPRIVGYNAKWTAESVEYVGTPRTFEFAASEHALLEELQRLALAACKLFGARGYARVDFRVDDQNRPWILELNCNPCLTPEAGFWAMLNQAGLTYDQAIERIAAACLH
jgi:D-alanine-D-alanine ligase